MKLTLYRYSGKYFYVPERACWDRGWTEEVIEQGKTKLVKHPALKHVKENVDTTLTQRSRMPIPML
ncbi:MAG: hypothetical protein AAFR89_13910 [Cyanobacteria bacterium J06633_1]